MILGIPPNPRWICKMKVMPQILEYEAAGDWLIMSHDGSVGSKAKYPNLCTKKQSQMFDDETILEQIFCQIASGVCSFRSFFFFFLVG